MIANNIHHSLPYEVYLIRRDNVYLRILPCIRHHDKHFTPVSHLIFTIRGDSIITILIYKGGKLPTSMLNSTRADHLPGMFTAIPSAWHMTVLSKYERML